MKSNGEFLVYLVEGNQWKRVGSLTFDRFFREREIALDFSTVEESNAKIALVQIGGGAAHIDSVFLGDSPPSSVFGTAEYEKIQYTDLDVLDAHRKTLILKFPADVGPKILRLTARIEGDINLGVPFYFPQENQFKEIDMDAVFYTYSIQAEAPDVPVSSAPLFKAFCQSASGHPDGFTYGWVWNDDKNLYVDIDFTGDNTMDGTKDFTKVYLKSNGIIKEFKVSEDQTRWGNSEFVYTDKVNWQHKVYHFQIPLEEARPTDSVLLLAFSAYGTDETASACCLPDGTCKENQPQETCESRGGRWNPNSLCSEISCTPESVPAINQWGFIVFGILLAGSAIWFIQRKKRSS